METAKLVLTKQQWKQPDWFTMEQEHLTNAIKEQNTAHNSASKDPTDQNAHHQLREKQQTLHSLVKQAILRW